MIFVESEHGPGAVGFIGAEVARYHSFTVCFTGLNVPRGTRMFSGIGYETSYNRNAVIAQAFLGCDNCHHIHRKFPVCDCKCENFKDQGMEWVSIWDDDHTFSPETLMAMLERQVDVLMPLYAQRQPPYRPCIYKDFLGGEGWRIYSWEELEGKRGLLPIAAAGAGGILIRRPVIEALNKDGRNQWFEHENNVGEDMTFFKKCTDAGFQPYVDLNIPIGHTTPVEVWPNTNRDGHWGAKVNLQGTPPQYVEFWPLKYQEK